jgi:hypothetical protein
MDPLDKSLARAVEISLDDPSDEAETELEELLPPLVKAGYVREQPWGEGPDWFLWSFTEAGVKRADELDAWKNSD